MSSFLTEFTLSRSYSIFGENPIMFQKQSSTRDCCITTQQFADTMLTDIGDPLINVLKRISAAYGVFGVNPLTIPDGAAGDGCYCCETPDELTTLMQSVVTNPLKKLLDKILLVIELTNPELRRRLFLGTVNMKALASVEAQIGEEYIRYIEIYGEPTDWVFDPALLAAIRTELGITA
jgi:hypothetical protein